MASPPETSQANGMMHFIDIPHPGGPEALRPSQQPIPVPGDDQVLIRVHAAGVNRADLKQRAGNYPMPAGAGTVPGLEVSGIIQAVGAEVSRWRAGDRVCALLIGGGYAQYCVAPAGQVLPIPENLDFIQAAALPETVFTVWCALFEQAGLQPGETVLIHGGASGIGSTAIQMASALGSSVIATARNAERCALCIDLGASLAIPYQTHDFVEEVLAHTKGKGCEVVLDMVGASYSGRNLRALSVGGRLCFIAGDSGPEAAFNIREIMLKRLWITGSTLRHRAEADKERIRDLLESRIWPLLAQGRIRPIVDKVFDLSDAAKAHHALEQGQVAGKAVLRVSV